MGLPSEVNAFALGGGTGYQIERSLRLRSSASAFLSRTFGTTYTDKTKWTLSFWTKRSALTVNNGQLVLGYNSGGRGGSIGFSGQGAGGSSVNDDFFVQNRNGTTGASDYTVRLLRLFRDPAAWYHIVVQFDSTQATASDRVRIYVNGTLQSGFGGDTSYPSLNYQSTALLGGNGTFHWFGAGNPAGPLSYYDGYFAETIWVDGQSLTPSSFGYTDTQTGIWTPKAYAGTYGTNGYYLKFTDNSGATATTIGKDFSGNGNNWTPNNISVTLGTTYDSMLDVPTNYADGGTGRGNYATLNPLVRLGSVPLVNGNLQANSTGPNNATQSTAAMPAGLGKWYAEFQAGGSQFPRVGVSDATDTNNNLQGSLTISWGGNTTGEFYVNGVLTAQSAGGYSTEIIGIAFDAATRRVWFSKNGVWQNFSGSGADPATNTNPAGTLAGSSNVFFAVRSENTTVNANFGQRPFAYTPPTGFRALNTQNLPTPSIVNGNSWFDATVYSGNSTIQNVVNSGGMQPNLVWIKNRSSATDNILNDSARGAGTYLISNLNNAETTNTIIFSAFNSNGFQLNNAAQTNSSGSSYVGWQWKEGPVGGFDIVTYTGDGSSNGTAHNLGVRPNMVIYKRRSSAQDWGVIHSSLPDNGSNAYFMRLNTTTAQEISTNTFPLAGWSSTQIPLGTNAFANGSGQTYVAYVFAAVSGFSAFGSYTGNGSADGPFVWCGFRPRFVLYKDATAANNWEIIDTARSNFNVCDDRLFPSAANAENTAEQPMDILSNGFKLRDSYSGSNANGVVYIFAAFAENPFKIARAR